MNKDVPAPSVMPLDRETWYRQLGLTNFVNSYYQYRDLQLCGDAKKVLVVGPGQGLDAVVLKWQKYEVTTFDIDTTFNPDVIGSVHDLSMFKDCTFDAIIASHVLEHLAVPYLDRCLSEMARVGKYSIIYLPIAGRHFQMRLKMDLKGIDFGLILDVFNYFHRPDGITPRYCAGQHYWEVGMRGFRPRNMAQRFAPHFKVLRAYRNKDWIPSYNLVFKSRYNGE